MSREHVDLSAVEAFVLVAELQSFTQAAEIMGITQAGMSLKISRLEKTLGWRLLERTPRQVLLSRQGEEFLVRARDLLSMEQAVLAPPTQVTRVLRLGVSDHVAGQDLPDLLKRVNENDPALRLQTRVGRSHELLDAYADGKLDMVIARRDRRRHPGELLFEESYGWYASEVATKPTCMGLISVDGLCSLRDIAIQLLCRANIEWTDAFVGGGMATVLSAVRAGLGVAPLPRRLAKHGLRDVEQEWQLPPLPDEEIMMYCKLIDPQTRDTLQLFRRLLVGLSRKPVPIRAAA